MIPKPILYDVLITLYKDVIYIVRDVNLFLCYCIKSPHGLKIRPTLPFMKPRSSGPPIGSAGWFLAGAGIVNNSLIIPSFCNDSEAGDNIGQPS